MQYRSEIDGLRAVAVIPVILFHAGFSPFSGGFIGVDVFFVISGYLITTIILQDLQAGTFSLVRFYERRARRILPALFFVLFCCIPFAWMWMLPNEFESFGKSLISVLVFGSNFFFFGESGYFEPDMELKPLLHTWSLAVEEQFYIVFPLLLWSLWRKGRSASLLAFAVIAFATLLLCEYASRVYPGFNFYSPITRTWELIAGAICVFVQTNRHKLRDDALSAIGLGFIFISIFSFDKETRFPSLFTLLPVGGTCLILMFGYKGTIVARLLSIAPLSGIGLISFSAYLWHQPLLAFTRLYVDEPLGVGLMGSLAFLSLAAGYLSWRFVELPFRVKGPIVQEAQRLFVRKLFLAATVLSFASIACYLTPPLIAWTEPHLFLSEKAFRRLAPWSECPGFKEIKTGDAECRSYGNGPKRAVIWGDSHAHALGGAVTPVDGYTLILINHLGCPPAPGLRRYDNIENARNCAKPETLNRYRDYVLAGEPSKIFLVGRWSLYTNGWWRQGVLNSAAHYLTDLPSETAATVTAAHSEAVLEKSLVSFVEHARSKTAIYFVTQPLDLNFLSRRQLVRMTNIDASAARDWHSGENALAERLMQAGANIIDTKTAFCSGGTCWLRKDGVQLYRDDNHLSQSGAETQFRLIRNEM